MNTQHSAQFFTAIREFLDDSGGKLAGYNLRTDYSGRGMFGRQCIALDMPTLQDVGRLFFHLGAVNELRDDLTMELFDWSWDQMGLGVVVYWPHMEFDFSTLGVVEEEEEEEEGDEHG